MRIQQANDIDEVVTILDDIIHDAMTNNSRAGYFAALYRMVTVVVRDKCNEGFFDDNERMRRLDTTFANRYFTAYDTFQQQVGMPSDSWTASFEQLNNKALLILQHLLLGMNAHIALDLGIATAEIADGDLSESLRGDFFRLNNILAALVNVVQDEIAEVSPLIGYLDKWAWNIDETVVGYGINLSRDSALEFAEELVALPQNQWDGVIQARDNSVAKISRWIIADTGFPFRLMIWFINLRENKDPRQVTEIMGGETWQNTVVQHAHAMIVTAQAQGVDLATADAQILQK